MDCLFSRRSPPLGEEEQQRHLSVKKISPPVRLEARGLVLVLVALAPCHPSQACLRFIKATAGLEKRTNSPIRRVCHSLTSRSLTECNILPQLGVRVCVAGEELDWQR